MAVGFDWVRYEGHNARRHSPFFAIYALDWNLDACSALQWSRALRTVEVQREDWGCRGCFVLGLESATRIDWQWGAWAACCRRLLQALFAVAEGLSRLQGTMGGAGM
jgi:hypothetical protein